MALRTIIARSPIKRGCARDPGIRSICVFLLFLLPCFLIPPQASADWNTIWSEDFESWTAEGWNLQTFGATDRLILAPGGAGKCEGYVLKGESRSSSNGNGFCATSPSFSELGLNLGKPYSISFKYKLPDNCFCWTYAMASRDASLVASECDGSGQRARIGLVDHEHKNFQPMGTLSIGDWHDIKVTVQPIDHGLNRLVLLYVNGVLRGTQLRTTPSNYDRIQFMDLPARVSNGNDPFISAGNCFGSGSWDEISLSAVQIDDRTPDKEIPDIQVAPNPFNPATNVQFNMQQPGLLNVDVYDVSGRHVSNLFAGHHISGLVELMWHGQNDRGRAVASGVYLIRVATPLGVTTDRAILVR